jgi:hypothetical protein
MKHLFSLFLFVFVFGIANSQIIDSKVDFGKTSYQGIMAEFAHNSKLIETILEEDMKNKGMGKSKSSKGFLFYQAINFPKLSTEKLDFYFKVEENSKDKKNQSIIYVLVSKGGDQFISSADNAAIMNNVKDYLRELVPQFENATLQVKIKEQEELVKKEDKAYTRLVDEEKSLEDRKKKIEKDLIDNKSSQQKQKTELEKQKQVLQSLKAKLKN